jgi:hypothetical protein
MPRAKRARTSATKKKEAAYKCSVDAAIFANLPALTVGELMLVLRSAIGLRTRLACELSDGLSCDSLRALHNSLRAMHRRIGRTIVALNYTSDVVLGPGGDNGGDGGDGDNDGDSFEMPFATIDLDIDYAVGVLISAEEAAQLLEVLLPLLRKPVTMVLGDHLRERHAYRVRQSASMREADANQ